VNDRVTKLAEIEDLGAGLDLAEQALEREIDNLGGFLVLGADVAVLYE
jgi:hypothetical protein